MKINSWTILIIICFLYVLSPKTYSNSYFDADNTDKFLFPEEDPYLPFAEEMPEPIGGLEAIYKKIEYPDIAKKAGLEGKVYLLVMINEKGSVDDVKVIKGLGAGCEDAAVKAVKESKYKPGKNGGVPIKVKLSLSITFKLR